MQNIYLPNRFYFIWPHDNSWSFRKIWNNKNNNIYAFTQIYDYFLILCWF